MRTTVLLVEDNDDDAALITRVLTRFKRIEFVVERVASLADAKARLAGARFDACVADLGLPDSDGLSTFENIHAAAHGGAVLVLTGDDREDLGLRAVELGAQEYIVKAERAWPGLPLSVAYAVERVRRLAEINELSAALAHAVDAITRVDERGMCVGGNPAIHSLLGYAVGEIEGMPFLDLIHPSDRAHVASALAAARPDELHETEARAIRKDNRLLPLQISINARAGGRGHFVFVRDLTRKKTEEEKLAASVSVTAIGSFATGLAHEINNPLAVVLANVEEAVHVTGELEGKVPEDTLDDFGELRTMLQEAHSASQRVQNIVRDVRVFACPDHRSGRVDINTITESCCNIVFAEIRHRAKLTKKLNAAVPIIGNEAKLAQLVLNLLVNAAQAMPEGMVTNNEITVETRQQGRGTVVLEISDTGSGIDPAIASKVFDAYFSTKPRRPGMGLAIARAAVSAHSGELTLSPRPGGGTIAKVALPTVEAGADDATKTQKESALQRRVLVVDDDPLVLRSLTRILARDFEVAQARNGREALDLVRAGGSYDAMLCDLVMSELSGIELHEVLTHDDPELAKRTVFLTGGAFTGRAQTFLDTVGQPHLEKPVDLKEVRDLLMRMSRPPEGERTSVKWLARGD
ncbi:MAG: response regulator [Labilithrix sp.]|nr:response regulator [Labilithrix sp.]MCW5810939.1 response regulator [Labilithrix sp.]